MKKWEEERKKIIGLGESSFRKSYYPELQNKIDELENSSHNLQKILNSMSDAIIIHDYEGKILYYNNQACKFYNLHPDEVYKYTISDISAKNSSYELLSQIWNEVGAENSRVFEWTALQIGTQKEIPIQVSLNPIHWNGALALIAVIRDFTELKQAERTLLEKNIEIASQNEELKLLNEQLLDAKKKANESEQLKMAFLANISHEIRTPLTGILGFSQLLTMEDVSKEEQFEFTEIIGNCGVQLMTIIDDIIDIAKIEANQVQVEKKPVNINDIFIELDALYKEKATKQNIDLTFHKEFEDKRSIIKSDSGKIRQILINLIGNSLKFTQKGHIKCGYRFVNNFVEFYVEDTGIGIEEEMQDIIFNRFMQVQTEFSKMTGGTGLGLSISRALTELLGGEIWVESKFGQGSTFHFTIPYVVEDKIAIEDIENSDLYKNGGNNQKTVLIAEDEYFNFLYLSKLLATHNYTIFHATNGIEALDMVMQNANIDIVLMDIKMPLMDGYQATAEIKKYRKNLPIIAQTAYAQDSDRKKALESGCDDYISKPYKNEDFLALIKKYIGD